jgi:arginase
MKNIKIIEVKSELGASKNGASLGIDAIKAAATKLGNDFFKRHTSQEIEGHGVDNSDFPIHIKRIKETLDISERVAQSVKSIIEENIFPVVISSDHSTSVGTISGIKMAYPKESIAVIWIDAHADIHSPYTTPSWNTHGMPLAAALGEDNMSMKVNVVEKVIFEYWERFKNIGNMSPKIYYSDLVYVGLRDYEKEEDFLLKKNNVCIITVDEIEKNGMDIVIEKVLNTIKSCEHIYISFDVDSLDPSVSKGTGLSVPNGITDKQAESLILKLIQDKRVCCIEITEINPTLEKENKTAEIAFSVLEKVENQIV